MNNSCNLPTFNHTDEEIQILLLRFEALLYMTSYGQIGAEFKKYIIEVNPNWFLSPNFD